MSVMLFIRRRTTKEWKEQQCYVTDEKQRIYVTQNEVIQMLSMDEGMITCS
jgi:hypothetical protein